MNIGEWGLYELNAHDAEAINRRRTTGLSIADRMQYFDVQLNRANPQWPAGAQAHIGSIVSAGEQFPMLVVKANSDATVNGQVFLDGTDVLWVQNVFPSMIHPVRPTY